LIRTLVVAGALISLVLELIPVKRDRALGQQGVARLPGEDAGRLGIAGPQLGGVRPYGP